MSSILVEKRARPGWPSPNLERYEGACAEFSWQGVRRELDGLPGGGLNIAH